MESISNIKKTQANRMDTKTGSIILLLYTKITPQYYRQTLPRVKCWERIFQSNGHTKQADVTFLISNKIGFIPKLIQTPLYLVVYCSGVLKIQIKNQSSSKY